jgi:hypothetical protein
VEKGFGGIVDGAWNVQLDGTPMIGLKTGTFAFADRPNGKLELGATEAAFPGVTRYEVTAQAGRTHFFVARISKRKNAMIAAAGATGGGILGAGAQHRIDLGLRQSRADRLFSARRGGRKNDYCGASAGPIAHRTGERRVLSLGQF